jgi:hypothetical protein
MYNTSPKNVYCVYNPKDPRTFFDLSPLASKIAAHLKLWNKDVLQIFPHCSSRMQAKGIMGVIRVFAALKREGLSVAIIFANANSKSAQDEIMELKILMKDRYDLVENEDYIFTSDWTKNKKPLPRKDIADLMRLANIFVFASWRETVGNCFQEAKISGNLLVLNQHLPCLVEMGGKDAIYFSTDHKIPGVKDHFGCELTEEEKLLGDLNQANYPLGEDAYYNIIAKKIADRLYVMPRLAEKWKFSYEWIWKNQFKPLLYGDA